MGREVAISTVGCFSATVMGRITSQYLSVPSFAEIFTEVISVVRGVLSAGVKLRVLWSTIAVVPSEKTA